MEVLTERLTKGTLQHLQKLEQQANEVGHGKDSRIKQEKMLRALQKAVQQLQERRDYLRIQIANSPNKVLEPILKASQPDDQESLSQAVQEGIETSADKKTLREAVKDASRLKQRELTVSYRLTGTTVHNMDDNSIRVRWDTFDRGEYFQPYYAIIAMKANEALQLVKHTLPYFLPIKEIVAKFLNKDIQCFVQTVSDYLNSFISRQKQIAEAEEKNSNYIRGEVITSNAYDNVSLRLFNPHTFTDPVDIQLVYDDLQDNRPTRVIVQSAGTITRQQTSLMRVLFTKQRLTDAISEVCRR